MAQCITPYMVTPKVSSKSGLDRIPVPCGKCPMCRARLVSGWSFRLMQHDKYAESSHFVTLTYDTESIPISRNGFMQLCKRDVQLFFKKLRKANERVGNSIRRGNYIKYFLVGEYGGRTKRPHYHVILFNSKPELIQAAWGNGFVDIGTVSGASVGYTMKYMWKKAWSPMHKNDDREPEFRLMSKGLGLNYITPEIVEWHKLDPENRVYVVADGKKITMPRYYKDFIYTTDERKRIAFYGAVMHALDTGDYDVQQVIEGHLAEFRRMEKTSHSYCKL